MIFNNLINFALQCGFGRLFKQWRRLRTTSSKTYIYILLSNSVVISICSVRLSLLNLAQGKYITPVFNSKWKNKKLAVVVHVQFSIIRRTWSCYVVVLQTTPKKCARIYNARTYIAIASSLNLLFSEVLLCRCHRGLLKLLVVTKLSCSLTILTFLTLESSSTQTTVSFVGKTGLTGCVVLAGVINTSALNRQAQAMSMFIKYKINAIIWAYKLENVTRFFWTN